MFFFEVILGFDFRIALSKYLLEAIDNLNDLNSVELGADPNDEAGYSPHKFSFSRVLMEPPIRTPKRGRQAFSC
jgi:hypothetical protein